MLLLLLLFLTLLLLLLLLLLCVVVVVFFSADGIKRHSPSPVKATRTHARARTRGTAASPGGAAQRPAARRQERTRASQRPAEKRQRTETRATERETAAEKRGPTAEETPRPMKATSWKGASCGGGPAVQEQDPGGAARRPAEQEQDPWVGAAQRPAVQEQDQPPVRGRTDHLKSGGGRCGTRKAHSARLCRDRRRERERRPAGDEAEDTDELHGRLSAPG